MHIGHLPMGLIPVANRKGRATWQRSPASYPQRACDIAGQVSAHRRDAGVQVDIAEDLVADLGFRLRASVQVLRPSAVVWVEIVLRQDLLHVRCISPRTTGFGRRCRHPRLRLTSGRAGDSPACRPAPWDDPGYSGGGRCRNRVDLRQWRQCSRDRRWCLRIFTAHSWLCGAC